MLKLLDAAKVVDLAPHDTTDRIDQVEGDPDLAAMLDALRTLLDLDGIAMRLITATGDLGQTVASVWPGGSTDEVVGQIGRAADGARGRWLAEGGSAGPIFLTFMQPRARDRIALLCRAGLRARRDLCELEAQVTRHVPLIERAVAQWARAHVQSLRLREQSSALDALGSAIMVVDADSRVRTSNAAARSLFTCSNVVAIANDRLAIRNLDDAMRFQVSVQHVLSTGEMVVVAVRRRGATPLLLVISPVATRADAAKIVTVQLVDPDAELALPLDALSRHFDWTQAERRLIEQLVRGRTLGEAAGALRLKEQTARTYLKHIFQKTGLCRQVELIRMVLAGAVPRCIPAR